MVDLPNPLLSQIYGAATDNSKWVAVCDELNRITDCPVQLFGHSMRTHESIGSIGAGIAPESQITYRDYFGGMNPWMHMNLEMAAGEVGVSDQALDRQDLFQTEFYNDWLRPQDNVVAGAGMVCYRSAQRFAMIAITCRKRIVDDSLPVAEKVLAALSPHLRRSIEMSGALMNGGGRSMQHLQASRHGVILVHNSGRAGFANAAATRFLDETCALSVGYDGRLTGLDAAMQSHLDRSVRAMQDKAYDTPFSPLTFRTAAFGTCVLHAHPFPESCEHDFPEAVWSDPVVGCYVIAGRLGIDAGSDVASLARALGATPAEAHLAQALMDGHTLNDYADAKQLSRHTVRNQMRALLSKTGMSSQMDFVRHLHQLSSPFGIFNA
jgi:DNA-binding CsgD family transcriptional regulator